MAVGILTFEPFKSESLDAAVGEAISIVHELRHNVLLIFDGAAIPVTPDSTTEKVMSQVHQKRLRRRSANEAADLERLVRELTEATRDGRLRWGPTSEDGLFRTTSLRSGVVRVGKWHGGHYYLYLGDEVGYNCLYDTNTSMGDIPGLAELHAEIYGRVHDEGIARFLNELRPTDR